ncbi:MAG TPA: hypothetical protein VHZ07_07250 [Bryobacteraceae bacterium]|jgi:hypothetical protein|nr:hypothetical protein [Bryobacteraceae bacterium]
MKRLLTSSLLTVFAVPFLMAAPATKTPAKQDTTQTTKTKKSHKKHKKSTATSTTQSK